MLISLDFILKDCLDLHIDVDARREIAQIVDRHERTVEMWIRKKNFPSKQVDKLTDHFRSTGRGVLVNEVLAESDKTYLAVNDAIIWKFYCLGMLASKELVLPITIKSIYDFSELTIDLIQNIRKLANQERLGAYKDYLIGTLGPKFGLPEAISDQMKQSSHWHELRPGISWFVVEIFVYFLALAEVEFLQSEYNISESKILEWVLPQHKKGKFLLPLQVYFANLFERLVSKGHFSSVHAVAKKLIVLKRVSKGAQVNTTHIDVKSAWREVQRAKNAGEPISLETHAAWLEAIFPRDNSDNFEPEKHLLTYLFGTARIMNKVYRNAQKDLSNEQLLSHFQRYGLWHKFHLDAWTPPPSRV